MPVAPYDMTQFVPADQITGDIIHRFYHEQLQIDNGRMDKFVTWSDNGGLVVSYIAATNPAEGLLSKQFGMCASMPGASALVLIVRVVGVDIARPGVLAGCRVCDTQHI